MHSAFSYNTFSEHEIGKARVAFLHLQRRIGSACFVLPRSRRFPSYCFIGAGNRNRTYDLIITNDALYQLSYPGVVGNFKALAELGQFTVKLRSNYKPGAGCGSQIIGDTQTTITIADKAAPTNTNPPIPIAILSAVRTQCFPARHRAR